ncbi:Transcriptional repressor tup11 [Holothuria leucospilota]|uniref:Transcriptional repressor tup11 n=1 Tax=Holothuria leucospilota TaxID=206669 RepID=A0A9Q1CLW9_HOLLE|nr:Transcriptional repressor tup11 [Holothuria leucospilota]
MEKELSKPPPTIKEAENEMKKENEVKTDPYFMNIPHGFQQKHFYEHSKKLTDLVDVTLNTRTRQFILLDTRGITTWTKDGISNTVTRSLSFPKYQNNLLRSIIFAKKFNVYFCLAHDFSLKVLNKNFEETCTADSDLSSVMFMVFNPVRDELITGGVKGTKIWEFKQIADRIWTEIKPMANYGLFLKKELDSVGGSWVRKLELNERMQHLYCCSDTDMLCYDMDGKFLFKIVRAHKSQITGCKYSPLSRMLVTGSFDTEVKVWSMTGGLVHTFRGHSRAVTNVVLHPESSSLVLTSSLDGTVRMWSLDIMEEIYSIVMSTEGICWMGLIADRFLWTATSRELFVWNIDQTVHFYALARSKVTSIQVAQCEGKRSRVVAVGDDSSVRLVSMKDHRNLSTVLPPPSLSPLQSVLAVSYNRECSLVYLLINPEEIWVYTMRTDPACRTAVWDVSRIQERFYRVQSAASRSSSSAGTRPSSAKIKSSLTNTQIRRATAEGMGPCPSSACTALTALTTDIMYWTDEGYVSPLQSNFLVLGLEDGRIVFLDPIKFGHRYCELQACKDSILELYHNNASSCLITRSHLREQDMFQIWSLPQLDLKHEILAKRDATCYAYSNNTFLVGHKDGAVILYKFTSQSANGESFSIVDGASKVDHSGPVLSVDSCSRLGVYVSCSGDGVIKIWNENKVLCTEITVEESLTAAKFLNQEGDLLVGYKNHLFCIHRNKVLASLLKFWSKKEEAQDSESEIYEDPAVKYEGAAANPDPISLETYLVPYNLDFSERFLGGGSSPQQSQHSSDQDGDSDSDSGFSMAPTHLYHSPSSTPRRLSFVDLVVPDDCITSDKLRNQSVTIITKRKSGRLVLSISKSEDPSTVDDFDMPFFGTSPGPSPTPSPPSTPDEFSVSERESEDEEEQEEEETEVEQPLSRIEEEPSPEPVKIPESLPEKVKPQTDESFRLTDTEETPRSKYGLFSMKIDSKSLIKGTEGLALTQTPKKIVTVSPRTDKIQDSLEESPAGKKVTRRKIEKKKQQGDRQRVRGREISKVSLKEEREEDENMIPSKRNPQEKASVKQNAVLKPESKGQNATRVSSVEVSKVSQSVVSVKNLSVEENQVRAAYIPKSSSSSAAAVDGKTSKKKKSSIFSNYKKPKGTKAGTGDETSKKQFESIDDLIGKETSEGGNEIEEDASGAAMYKTATRASIVQKYSPLDRLSSAGSKNDPYAPAPTPVDITLSSPEPPVKVNLANLGRSQSAVQHRDHPLPRDSRSKSAGTKGHFPDGYLGDEILPLEDTHTLDPSLEKMDSITEPSDRASLVLSDSDVDGQSRRGLFDMTMEQSYRTLSSAAGSLQLGSVSRPSTAFSVGEGALSLLSNGADLSMSRPLSVMSSVELAGLSPELQEIATLKGALPLSSDMEGYHARPNTAEGERTASRYPTGRRPHTAGAQMHVTFLDEMQFGRTSGAHFDTFDGETDDFVPFASPPPEVFKYHKNDGLNLQVDWQDKMIQRHQLMKIQKELRARSAADKRRLLDLRKRQKQKALTGHHDCTEAYQGKRNSSSRAESVAYSFSLERSKSAPAARVVQDAQQTRSQNKKDTGTASSQVKQETTSPYSKGDNCPSPSRPKTGIDYHRNQHNFTAEKSFRFRLSSELSSSPHEGTDSKPQSVMESSGVLEVTSRLHPRPHTSKSIPSKTRRYLLVTPNHSDTQIVKMTPLEAQLLAERFPKSKERILKISSLSSNSHVCSSHRVIPNLPEYDPASR